MLRAEIDELIEKSEWRIKTNLSLAPTISWFLTFFSTPFLFLAEFPFMALLFGVLLSVVSVCVSITNGAELKRLRENRALTVWEYLGTSTEFGHQRSSSTDRIGMDILNFYQHDTQGKLLPLHQAVSLVDTYGRQQKRLQQLTERIAELYVVELNLSEKLEKLRALGEGHESGEQNLGKLKQDITAVKAVSDQIEASCHRLEMLLISVQKAYQIKQLNREITGLTSRGELEELGPDSSFGDELADIERQLGREIETFLQLERETDKHLQ